MSISINESVPGGATLWLQGSLDGEEPDKINLAKMDISGSEPSGNEKSLWLQSSELSGLSDPDIIVDVDDNIELENPVMVFTDETGRSYKI